MDKPTLDELMANRPPERYRKTKLSEADLASMKVAFTNPANSLSDAWFYAAMTGQGDVFSAIDEAMQRIFALFNEMEAEGLLNVDSLANSGCAGAPFQRIAEARQAEDPRFAEIFELTKRRFLIEIADHETNVAMVEQTKKAGCPGAIGLLWNEEHQAAATKPDAAN